MKPRIISVIVGAILSPSLSIASQSVAYATGNAPYQAGLLSWEAPAYPFLAKLRHCQGRGVFRVTINPVSGHPAQIVMLKSTGFGYTRRQRVGRAPGMAVEVRNARAVRHSDYFYPFKGPKPREAASRQFPFTEVTKMTGSFSLGQGSLDEIIPRCF
jgi:hypothetical protein